VSTSLDRIAALLAKAERTDNEIEAEAYLMKAQELATLASVDLAVARARTAKREARQQPEARTIHIGERGKRANTHLVSLFVAIGHANDVHVDVASNSTYVISYGMPADLDVVATMYASLAVQMVHASQLFLNAGTWKGETYSAGRWDHRPHTAQTARVAFYRAFVARIGERLTQARQSALKEQKLPRSERKGQEVVLREKSVEVRAFHRASSQARGTWGGYSGGVRRATGSAARAGHSAASRARLGKQPELPQKGPGVGA
jgi:hypothetical protein